MKTELLAIKILLENTPLDSDTDRFNEIINETLEKINNLLDQL